MNFSDFITLLRKEGYSLNREEITVWTNKSNCIYKKESGSMEITSKMKIHKPVSEVFTAFVNPDQMANYWFSSGSNRLEQGKDINWNYVEYGAEVVIHVVEVKENNKIFFSWGEGEQATHVQISLIEDESGTIVEVIESGFNENNPELVHQLLDQKGGWIYMLTCLKGYLENGTTSLRASLVH